MTSWAGGGSETFKKQKTGTKVGMQLLYKRAKETFRRKNLERKVDNEKIYIYVIYII